MSVLEMQKKEVIQKIEKIEDQVLLGKINELINATFEKPQLSANELFEFTVSRFDETLKRLAQ